MLFMKKIDNVLYPPRMGKYRDPVILSRTGTRIDLDLDRNLDLDPGTGNPAYSLL